MPEAGVERSIGRLEGKIDLVIKDMNELKGAFSTLEAGRLLRLETQVAGLVVRVTIIGAAMPLLVEGIFFIARLWFK